MESEVTQKWCQKPNGAESGLCCNREVIQQISISFYLSRWVSCRSVVIPDVSFLGPIFIFPHTVYIFWFRFATNLWPLTPRSMFCLLINTDNYLKQNKTCSYLILTALFFLFLLPFNLLPHSAYCSLFLNPFMSICCSTQEQIYSTLSWDHAT